MMKVPPCGSYCKNCIIYKKVCTGCVETNGKPFYIKEVGKDICPVWHCAIEHKVEHCGICNEFPCDQFLGWYDPKRGIITALRKAGLLVLRRKVGTKAWIEWIKDKHVKFGV